MSVHVYIAAPFELQSDAKRLAGYLERVGVKAHARWLYTDNEVLSDEWAMKCIRDVEVCDVLLAFNPEEYARLGTGGRHVELGYALALAKPVIVVGVRSNIFHFLRRVDLVPIDGQMIDNIMAAARRRGFTVERN